MKVLIEAAIESPDEADFAVRNGADRLELCDFSVEGGRTPLPDLARATRGRVATPLHLLIRPRGGNFTYAEPELRVMEQQVDQARQLGATAVVLGALLPGRGVDRVALARLIGRARPLEVVFHRAIDMTPDPMAALDALLALGVDRVLTSGGRATALDGVATIQRMVAAAGPSLVVMAGGGVRARNVRQIVEQTGVSEIHARDVSGIRGILGIT